jgi:ATP-dependent protease HslVU (ClpYQ) peptidase subunit
MHLKSLILASLMLFIALPGNCTTVAWDGTTLASDSQMTAGHRKLMGGAKFIRSDKRHATIALAGDVDMIKKLKDYFMSNEKPLAEMKIPANSTPDPRFQMLFIPDQGEVLFYDDDLDNPVPMPAPFAFGSGGDFALAAMIMGSSAPDAIEVAKELDVYTGGRTHSITAPQAPKLEAPPKLPELTLPTVVTPADTVGSK